MKKIVSVSSLNLSLFTFYGQVLIERVIDLFYTYFLTAHTTAATTNNLSKSTVQTLTRSTTNLDVIGPQNQIKPLPTVHNAPFEQTFRITVSLPHGQLYVARIGAKTKLSELLDMISTNKLLDPNKFEFRHPSKYHYVTF